MSAERWDLQPEHIHPFRDDEREGQDDLDAPQYEQVRTEPKFGAIRRILDRDKGEGVNGRRANRAQEKHDKDMETLREQSRDRSGETALQVMLKRMDMEGAAKHLSDYAEVRRQLGVED